MNLNQLHYFVTLAHLEHYTRAAKILSITQPSLSHAISSLEQELGTYLFEKQGRNVVLTKYGRVFLEYAEEALQILDAGVKKTKSMTSDISGQIDVGYIFTQGSEFMPAIVKSFLDENPEKQIEFNFSNGVTASVIQGVKEERFDVGFCSMMPEEDEIEFIPVSREELIAVVPKDHPLASKDEIDVEEIVSYPQIFFNEESGLRKTLDKIFDDLHVQPDIRYTVDEDGALAGMVAQGFGVGIVPNVPAVRSVNVHMLKLKNLDYRRYIYMAIVKNKYLSPIVRQFVNHVRAKYEIRQ